MSLYIFYWEPDENLIENRTIILTWYFFEGIQRNYLQNLIRAFVFLICLIYLLKLFLYCVFSFMRVILFCLSKKLNTFFKIEAIDLIDNFKNLKEINQTSVFKCSLKN